ncbi:MAG TPA: 5'-3' exonuclease H3TH domain-containing protein [Methylomirabilota bacterium]|nr:5'-3' exonuclease H3TH domain-containing protein [Methylomirabilota bacterium]
MSDSESREINPKKFVDRLLIVDGHAYAYRAFHAIRGLRAPDGKPTNAIYGFVKMLAKMRASLEPTHLIVVWDGGLCAERMELLPEYKAHRPEMPDDLRPQLDEIGSYLDAAGIESFCRDGVEADDYIACVARHAVAADMTVVIASGDKDFMQLVSPRVGLLNPNDKSEVVWTDEQVRNKAGVEPSQIVDWLSLIGDSVDNISGVPGVGPKTATDLLKQFGSVEKLYDRLAEVKSDRIRAALQNAESHVRRNRKMVRLHDDLQCEFSPEKLVVRPMNIAKLRELYSRWGFKGLLASLPETAREQQAILI